KCHLSSRCPNPSDIRRRRSMLLDQKTTESSIFDWIAPLFDLPARLPPSALAWAGHIPFLFLLFNLARPRNYVELGVMQGTSFLAACEAAKRYNPRARCHGIDTWVGDTHTHHYDDGDAIFNDLKSFLASHYPNAELIQS